MKLAMPVLFYPFLFFIDIIGMCVEIRRNVRGRGASGLPGIPLAFYWALVLSNSKHLLLEGEPWLLFKVVDVVGLTAIHFLWQWGIPSLHYRWLMARRARRSKRDAESGSAHDTAPKSVGRDER